jgi:hypothetical protein
MDIKEAIEEVQQPRSHYQMVHFVMGQHDTPEMQFYQLCQELMTTKHALELAALGQKKSQIKIDRLLATGDEIDAIEAEEMALGMEQTRIVVKGAERELAVLEDIFHSIPHFTRDEIEHAQPDYWEKRMTRQTNLQIMSGNVGWAQLDAMRQIGHLPELAEMFGREVEMQVQAELAQS